MRELLIAAAMLAIVPTQTSATAIIAVWSPDKFMIGADSVVSHAGGEKSDPICKIGFTNDVLWGFAGISAVNVHNPFDSHRIVADILSRNISFDERIKLIETNLISRLKDFLEYTKHSDIEFYTEHKKQLEMEGIFSTFINGQIRTEVRRFGDTAPVTDAKVNVELIRSVSCPVNCRRPYTIFSLGEHATIDNEIVADPGIWAREGVAPTIRFLIEKEALARPETVGGAISIGLLSGGHFSLMDPGVCGQNR